MTARPPAFAKATAGKAQQKKPSSDGFFVRIFSP